MDKHLHPGAPKGVRTTIGELVETITEIALEAGKTEKEGYRLASRTIESLLRQKRVRDHIN